MKKFLKNNLFSIILFIGMVVLWMLIPTYIKVSASKHNSGLSPRFFPRVAVMTTMVTTGLSILIDLLNYAKDKANYKAKVKDENVSYLRAFLVILMMFAWYLVVKPIGFCISTTLLMFGLSYLLGNRNKWTLILVPLIFSFAVFFVFKGILHVQLPEILF